jgi:hypothetical protein
MLDSVVFYYTPDSEDKSIDANEMKELTDAFNQALPLFGFFARYTVVNCGATQIKWNYSFEAILPLLLIKFLVS